MTQTTNFDNEMKMLSKAVYKGNEKSIPKDWIKVLEYNKKSGFYGEAFYKNGKVVIAIRGTDEILNDLVKEDIGHLAIKKLPSQYVDAQDFYEEIKKDFPNKEIIFTGHSLGGSLAQLMGNKTGCETVTFNAYGVADILDDKIKTGSINIRNYGNIEDIIFHSNLDNQLGEIYVTGLNQTKKHVTKENNYNQENERNLKHHFIESMGNLEDAVEYKPTKLEGKVSLNVDYKDIDPNRIFTREEIKDMSNEEYLRLENFINKQLKTGRVMAKAQAEEKIKTGDVIWVDDYDRADVTHVRGYYRTK